MPTTFLDFITTKRISWFTQDFMILIEKIWLTSTMATGHKDIFRFADDAKYCFTHKFSIGRTHTLCHKLWKWKKRAHTLCMCVHIEQTLHQKSEMIHLNFLLNVSPNHFKYCSKFSFSLVQKSIWENTKFSHDVCLKKLSFPECENWV